MESISARNETLDSLLRSSAVEVALFTTPLDQNGANGVEVSDVGTGYARLAASFAAPTGGQTVNTADLVWSQATDDWGLIAGYAIYRTSDGELRYFGTLQNSKQIDNEDQMMIPSGGLVVAEE